MDRRVSGKLITIYPKGADEARRIILDLYLLLKDYKGPEIFTDIAYKNSIIQYRYGNFFNKADSNHNVEKESKKIFPDNRNPGFYKPSDEIPDLFDGDSKFLEETTNSNNINGYVPKTPLYLNAYGGIFVAKKEGQFYILKEGRPYMGNGNFPYGEAILLRKKEVDNAKRINSRFFPKLIEFFEKERHFFSVFELKALNTILQWKESICFVFNSDLTSKKAKIEVLLRSLIKGLVELLREAKKINLVLNDIKADNILWYGGEEIYFIDLDTSFFLGEDVVSIKNSFFRREKVTNFITDVRKVGYLLFDLIANSSVLQNKHTNHSLVLSYFKYFAIELGLAEDVRDWILHFLNFKKRSKLDSFKQGRYPKKLDFSKPEYNFKLLDKLNFESIIFPEKPDSDFWQETYKSIKTGQEKRSIELIEKIIKEEVVVDKDKIFVPVKGIYFSPYLLDGTARLMYLILLFKESFNCDVFDSYLKKSLVPSLRDRFILKPSFLFGITGLAYTFLKAFKIFEDKSYLTIARQQLEVVKFFYLKRKDTFFNYDGELLDRDNKEMIEEILRVFYIDLKNTGL